ncbi:MAG: sel1 repeat family protein, partial [Clostridium sp.]|nr:sel1 repeat family protein [Clostridium sp.]
LIKKINNFEDEDIKIQAAILVEEGEKYYFGKDVAKDYKKAMQYFFKAAECGDEYGEAYLGLFYEKGYSVEKNYLVAFNWYYKSALKGNAFSQNALGLLYIHGRGIKKDNTAAMMWFQKSAENEYAPAFYQLGRIYYLGLGVDKNYDKAFYWYKKSAEMDLGIAQYAISFMYKNGEGCLKDDFRAYYWIEKSAENEYEDAYYIVGKSYLEGIFYDINYEKAFKYLMKGYEACDLNCLESLADMYLNGLYVEKDKNKALELYNLSIDYGSFQLYFKVGKIYEEENLMEQAISFYKQGHEFGDLRCTQRLGVIYYNGEGVSRDLNKSIEYMQVAAKNNAPHAMYVLGVTYLRLNKFKEKTEEIAKELFLDAYKLKSPYAAEYLAFISINEFNEGKSIDEQKLLEYINFGAEHGLTESIFQYGYIYEKGIAVKKDNEKSYYYYSLSAENEYIKAMNKLGEWYLRGYFVKQDIDLSIKWYEKSAEKNDIESMEKLIEIYENAIGGKHEEIKALYYVFKLIDVDALKGKCKLAYYCFKGIGIEIDNKKAYEILDEVEEIDKGSAYNLKGLLGFEGIINLNPKEIVQLFLSGIECGNSECYGNLAYYLYNSNLYKEADYKEAFATSLAGRKLGITKCKYIYLKKKLDEVMNNNVISLDEVILINKLKELINNGFTLALPTVIKWYEKRNMKDNITYLKYKEQQYFYNLKED